MAQPLLDLFVVRSSHCEEGGHVGVVVGDADHVGGAGLVRKFDGLDVLWCAAEKSAVFAAEADEGEVVEVVSRFEEDDWAVVVESEGSISFGTVGRMEVIEMSLDVRE